MSAVNTALIRGIYDDFAKGDVPSVVSKFSSEIVWNEAEDFPYADGNPYVGPGAVVNGVFARCATEWDGFGVNVEEILDAGDTVVVLGRYVGTFRRTGRAQSTQFVHVWRIAGGKAARFQQYANTLHVARVIN